jgi:hypothetical protein
MSLLPVELIPSRKLGFYGNAVWQSQGLLRGLLSNQSLFRAQCQSEPGPGWIRQKLRQTCARSSSLRVVEQVAEFDLCQEIHGYSRAGRVLTILTH